MKRKVATKKVATIKKKVAKKPLAKKVAKVVKPRIPAYDPKVHVKLSSLAKELLMDYRSLFLKQGRLGILASKALEHDREVVCFTYEQADKLRSSTAPFIKEKQEVELQDVEAQCKIDRPKMLRVLGKLKIVPEKRRRHEENPRSVLTVKANLVPRIKEAVKSLIG